jgi:hypothetical protein
MMTLPTIRKTFGIEPGIVISTRADYEALLTVWKRLVIAARRAGNEEFEKQLNACKVWIKDKLHRAKRHCPVCDCTIQHRSHACFMHRNPSRNRKAINNL